MEQLKEYDVSQFKGILELLVSLVIREIRKERGVSEVEATKLWHLSPCALVELLNSELETGNIIFPEEA
jgi:hypothetical protein